MVWGVFGHDSISGLVDGHRKSLELKNTPTHVINSCVRL